MALRGPFKCSDLRTTLELFHQTFSDQNRGLPARGLKE